MRKMLVAGNWKLNGSRATVDDLLTGVLSGLGDWLDRVDVMVCPATIHVQQVAERLEASMVGFGLQNVCVNNGGAFTGETSVEMGAEFGCRYALVGHSERRALYGETDADVVAKFTRISELGLVPVLCVGETLEEREQQQTEEVVNRQVRAVLDGVAPELLADFVIAYEPVWAIGTGKTASPEQAQEIHAGIRNILVEVDGELAGRTRILYGGSVKASNAAEIFTQPDVDGGLVGGASLAAEEFLAICSAAG